MDITSSPSLPSTLETTPNSVNSQASTSTSASASASLRRQELGERHYPLVATSLVSIDMEETAYNFDIVTTMFGSIITADISYGITYNIIQKANDATISELLENHDLLRKTVREIYHVLMGRIGAREPPHIPLTRPISPPPSEVTCRIQQLDGPLEEDRDAVSTPSSCTSPCPSLELTVYSTTPPSRSSSAGRADEPSRS